MSTDPIHSTHDDSAAAGLDAAYARLVARYSAPETVAVALEGVKAEARRRAKARELVTRSRRGLLHNHTVREIARYFRAAERGRVDLLQVAEDTGIPLSDSRQVLREFVDAGLLHEYAEPAGEQVRRVYELAEGGKGGMTEVFVETEAAAQREERGAYGSLGWGEAR
ncbi:hypothetical protein [Streptomyces sp. NPDC002187]|uniref:hypothetical protein n=1 Tax=Streptomyces sp. NPDC002187 TaxID=3364637 RepID=UPI0036747EAD